MSNEIKTVDCTPSPVFGVRAAADVSLLSFKADEGVLFSIRPDGTITRGKAFTTEDEMSLRFWKVIERSMPEFRRRIEQETEARVRAEYKQSRKE